MSSYISPTLKEGVLFTEIFEESPEPRFTQVWKRVHLRLITALRISKMMKNLKHLNRFSLQRLKSERYVEELLQKTEKYGKSFEKTSEDEHSFQDLIFHPSRGFKVYWDMFVGVCLLYTATFTPFLLAFSAERSDDVWFFIDILLSFVYFLDILVTLNTSFFDFDGTLIKTRKEIFMHYLKGWLFIDLVSTFPFDLVLSSFQQSASRGSYNFLAKLTRLKSAPRLFRLSKLLVCMKNSKMFPFLESWYYFFSFSSSAVKFLNTIFMIIMSLHIFTCFWFFIAKFEDFGPDTWVTRKDLQDVSTVKSYFFSLYWALVTLSTTGYGDISAKTRGELLVSIFWMIIALYFLSFSISSLSTMISEKDSGKNRQIDSKLSMVDAYASENNLPKKVKIKMQKMVKETSEKLFYQFNTKEKMMREMPAKIRMNIASSAHFGALSLFAILRDREEKFLYTIVPLLKTENVKAGTILFAAGNPCRDIYFMIHGKGYFVDREGVRFKVISPGSYFGDIEVVQNVKRIFDVVISEYSVLWVLTPDVFKIIQQEFIIFFKELKRDTAKRFDLLLVELSEMKALQKANLEMVRDVGNVRILIDLEYKKICQEFKLEQSEKNSISRIDRKLDLCKKLFLSNQNLLKRIQVDLRDLVRLTDEQDLKLN